MDGGDGLDDASAFGAGPCAASIWHQRATTLYLSNAAPAKCPSGCVERCSLMVAAPTHPVTVMQFLKVSINLALASAPRVVIAFYWGRITHRCRRRGPSARFHAPSPPLPSHFQRRMSKLWLGNCPFRAEEIKKCPKLSLPFGRVLSLRTSLSRTRSGDGI